MFFLEKTIIISLFIFGAIFGRTVITSSPFYPTYYREFRSSRISLPPSRLPTFTLCHHTNMASSITRTPLSPSPPSFFTKPVNCIYTHPSFLQLHPTKPISKNPHFLMCVSDPTSGNKTNLQIPPLSCLTLDHYPTLQPATVSEKVQTLDFEFKSLAEPIDRVKRLLQYATILPPFDESLRIQENRVVGCTAQVWLEARMDGNGVMRFRVDSDSEITKGFCSCLIWVLDGAGAEEVLSVKTEDLVGMNVGLPSRGNSRVNTWHNVLISMQTRTKDLVEEKGCGGMPMFLL